MLKESDPPSAASYALAMMDFYDFQYVPLVRLILDMFDMLWRLYPEFTSTLRRVRPLARRYLCFGLQGGRRRRRSIDWRNRSALRRSAKTVPR